MKVLYAEDEMQLSVAVSEILKMEGFEVTSVYDGAQAWEALQNDYYDAVILDIMMPVMDGIEVLQKMRENENYTAVLMLTAKATVDDRITGLTTGADDYLGKPFAMKELVARLNSLVRRSNSYRHATPTLEIANIVLDTSSGELKSDKGSLRLNNTEAELLGYFIKNPGVFYTAEEVNQLLWNGSESADKAELYIFYLKNKLIQIRSDAVVVVDGNRYSLGVKAS
ncbi:MAG: response regulator transcription factor [Ruminococcus sp.]|nr:response regulator transcription factor [Ruminococcus sp.]